MAPRGPKNVSPQVLHAVKSHRRIPNAQRSTRPEQVLSYAWRFVCSRSTRGFSVTRLVRRYPISAPDKFEPVLEGLRRAGYKNKRAPFAVMLTANVAGY
jgi:hypothetical protein